MTTLLWECQEILRFYKNVLPIDSLVHEHWLLVDQVLQANVGHHRAPEGVISHVVMSFFQYYFNIKLQFAITIFIFKGKNMLHNL